MGTSDVLAPGRFRLLLGALCLFLVGTAATTSLRRALLVEFVLLAVTVVVAVLELRSRGQRWLGTIGLAWAKLFETLDGVAPGSFRFPADTAWTAPGPLRYRYFSFVTLATLGYGDVTPVTALAGTLAALDAVSGQLYIAITVARLVALSMGEHVGPGGGPKSGG